MFNGSKIVFVVIFVILFVFFVGGFIILGMVMYVFCLNLLKGRKIGLVIFIEVSISLYVLL